MFGTLGTTEIIVIVLIILLLFGGKKIPELMRGLGSGVKEFKKASNDIHDDEEPRRDNQRLDNQRTRDDRRLEESRQEDNR